MQEIWKPMFGFEEKYECSNFGNVRSIDSYGFIPNQYGKIHPHTYKGKTLKQSISNNGYLRVNLHKNGHPKKILVHRYIALTFIPNPHNLPIVNHINRN